LIHTASPLSRGNETPKQVFEGAYYGSINVVEAAINAGIKKIVVTGSIVNLLDVGFKAAFGTTPLTAKTWGSATLDTITFDNADSSSMYVKGKTASEKRIWEIAHQHPEVDVTLVLPPVVIGPFVPNFPLTKEGGRPLGTLDYLHPILSNKYPDSVHGYLVDVRDVAKAHILSLSAPPAKDQDKRFLVLGKHFTWKEVGDVIRRGRPELASRLPGTDDTHVAQFDAPLDTSLTEELLGFSADVYTPWEQTVLDSIDQILAWEKYAV